MAEWLIDECGIEPERCIDARNRNLLHIAIEHNKWAYIHWMSTSDNRFPLGAFKHGVDSDGKSVLHYLATYAGSRGLSWILGLGKSIRDDEEGLSLFDVGTPIEVRDHCQYKNLLYTWKDASGQTARDCAVATAISSVVLLLDCFIQQCIMFHTLRGLVYFWTMPSSAKELRQLLMIYGCHRLKILDDKQLHESNRGLRTDFALKSAKYAFLPGLQWLVAFLNLDLRVISFDYTEWEHRSLYATCGIVTVLIKGDIDRYSSRLRFYTLPNEGETSEAYRAAIDSPAEKWDGTSDYAEYLVSYATPVETSSTSSPIWKEDTKYSFLNGFGSEYFPLPIKASFPAIPSLSYAATCTSIASSTGCSDSMPKRVSQF
jgi:hypothetical protein